MKCYNLCKNSENEFAEFLHRYFFGNTIQNIHLCGIKTF